MFPNKKSIVTVFILAWATAAQATDCGLLRPDVNTDTVDAIKCIASLAQQINLSACQGINPDESGGLAHGTICGGLLTDSYKKLVASTDSSIKQRDDQISFLNGKIAGIDVSGIHLFSTGELDGYSWGQRFGCGADTNSIGHQLCGSDFLHVQQNGASRGGNRCGYADYLAICLSNKN